MYMTFRTLGELVEKFIEFLNDPTDGTFKFIQPAGYTNAHVTVSKSVIAGKTSIISAILPERGPTHDLLDKVEMLGYYHPPYFYPVNGANLFDALCGGVSYDEVLEIAQDNAAAWKSLLNLIDERMQEKVKKVVGLLESCIWAKSQEELPYTEWKKTVGDVDFKKLGVDSSLVEIDVTGAYILNDPKYPSRCRCSGIESVSLDDAPAYNSAVSLVPKTAEDIDAFLDDPVKYVDSAAMEYLAAHKPEVECTREIKYGVRAMYERMDGQGGEHKLARAIFDAVDKVAGDYVYVTIKAHKRTYTFPYPVKDIATSMRICPACVRFPYSSAVTCSDLDAMRASQNRDIMLCSAVRNYFEVPDIVRIETENRTTVYSKEAQA